MANWTATKVNPRVDGDLFKVDVDIFKDGVRVKRETFETTQEQDADWPAAEVKRLIERLRSVPSMAETVAEGAITLPADPPAADPDRTTWFADLARAKQMQNLVELGVIDANDKTYTDLLETVRRGYQPEYIGVER